MQPQVLRLTTPRLKSTPGAPFAQDDRFVEERAVVRMQPQVLRLTTPRLKSAPGAPFAQDEKHFLLDEMAARLKPGPDTKLRKENADSSTHHPQAEEYAWGPVRSG